VIPGLKTISNLQCTAGLDYVLKTHRLQTCIINVDSYVVFSKIAPQLAVDLDKHVWTESVNNYSATVTVDEFWQQYDKMVEVGEKVGLLKRQLSNILRHTLKADENDGIDDDTSMQELGVDSLMFVEIKNNLQEILGRGCWLAPAP